MSQPGNKTARQSLLKVNHYSIPSVLPDPSVPLRGRPPKRSKPVEYVQPAAENRQPYSSTFIMKLFDRSVDLARFAPECSLYPVCRAWMRNQPRSRMNWEQTCVEPAPQRESTPDIVDRYREGKINEIETMPKSTERCELKPFVFEKEFPDGKTPFQLQDDPVPSIGRDELLGQHKKRWTAIRHRWQSHRREYLRKHQLSYNLLDAIVMKRAQN
ncbi:protein lin-37 homolog [Sabethes cyaneus]|uniref:protein lin-37 homolog n=1 Tax=Sabethes cyaneus TaxID=53552 RepID=UPI00237DDF90|nr:protein lin-37 homolog [Sabethes cyaneus]